MYIRGDTVTKVKTVPECNYYSGLDLFSIESEHIYQLEIVHVIFSNSTMDRGSNGVVIVTSFPVLVQAYIVATLSSFGHDPIIVKAMTQS